MPLNQKKRLYRLEVILSHTSWPENLRIQRSGNHRKPNRTSPLLQVVTGKAHPKAEEISSDLSVSKGTSVDGREALYDRATHPPSPFTPQRVALAGAGGITDFTETSEKIHPLLSTLHSKFLRFPPLASALHACCFCQSQVVV